MAGRRGAAGVLAVAAMTLVTGLGCTATTTQDRAAALLAADRGFGAASERPMLDQLGAAFSDRAMMPDGPRGLAEGRSALIASLGRDTLAPRSRVRWAPVRGGVSGDGTEADAGRVPAERRVTHLEPLRLRRGTERSRVCAIRGGASAPATTRSTPARRAMR